MRDFRMKAYQENVQTSFATCTLAVNEFEDVSITLVNFPPRVSHTWMPSLRDH